MKKKQLMTALLIMTAAAAAFSGGCGKKEDNAPSDEGTAAKEQTLTGPESPEGGTDAGGAGSDIQKGEKEEQGSTGIQPEAGNEPEAEAPVPEEEEAEEPEDDAGQESEEEDLYTGTFDFSQIPDYSGSPYYELNGGIPYFTADEITDEEYESYSPLDSLGRCGPAQACISKGLMPDEERGSIAGVRPAGWHTVKYAGINGNYLYNRCHLIGYQLTGENANERNLITGTRYLNVDGMLPFENAAADYIRETGNHVMYRVTPVYIGGELLCRGLVMEGLSVEDDGDGIMFCVYCYNVQPGIAIDYSSGDSEGPDYEEDADDTKDTWQKDAAPAEEDDDEGIPSGSETSYSYIANINTGKFHRPDCGSVAAMKEENKEYLDCSREEAISRGYEPCKNCDP